MLHNIILSFDINLHAFHLHIIDRVVCDSRPRFCQTYIVQNSFLKVFLEGRIQQGDWFYGLESTNTYLKHKVIL